MPIFQPRMLTGEYGYTLLKRGDVIEIGARKMTG